MGHRSGPRRFAGALHVRTGKRRCSYDDRRRRVTELWVEQHLQTFDVQITGSPTFDPTDQVWACEIAFTSGENLFSIPRQLVSDRWEEALNLVREFVRRYLGAGVGASVLRASKGVGFVEGDLHLVWPEAAA